MNNAKADGYYLNKILADLSFISKHLTGISKEQLALDEVLLDSMMFRLIQIQENARKLTDEFKLAHKNIPWTDISGLRNRIVHDYGNVDLSIVWETLTRDVPWLESELQKG